MPEDETTGYGGTKLGIDNLAKRGIAGRGILADIARYYESVGKSLDHRTNDVVPSRTWSRPSKRRRLKYGPGMSCWFASAGHRPTST